MKPTITYNGKKRKLSLSIDGESVNIFINRGPRTEPIHICYWHIDEVNEDADVAISIAKAIQLYYTAPQKLINILYK